MPHKPKLWSKIMVATDNLVRLPSPVKDSLFIDAIRLEYNSLRITCELNTRIVQSLAQTNSVVKLFNPVKSPLSIDVMLLEYRYLRMTHELSTCKTNYDHD